MERQARALAECETDEPVTGDDALRLLERVNAARRARGIEPYEDRDGDEPPEVELHRRAQRLGMVRNRG